MEVRIDRPTKPTGLRASLLSVEPLKNNTVMYRTEYTTDDTHLIIRIPRAVLFSDIRIKDETDADTGKRTQSATLVVSASANPECDTVFSFDAPEGTLKMPLKPSLNLNFGFVLGQKQFTPRTPSALAPPMREAVDAVTA